MDHCPLFWEHHDDVRSLGSAGFALEAQSAPLGDVFPALGKARCFENALQGELAPAAEELRIASQRLCESVRLVANRMAGFENELDLLFERENFAVFLPCTWFPPSSESLEFVGVAVRE